MGSPPCADNQLNQPAKDAAPCNHETRKQRKSDPELFKEVRLAVQAKFNCQIRSGSYGRREYDEQPLYQRTRFPLDAVFPRNNSNRDQKCRGYPNEFHRALRHLMTKITRLARATFQCENLRPPIRMHYIVLAFGLT